jgi:hypothetical protein
MAMIRYAEKSKGIFLTKVPTAENLADIITKPLIGEAFKFGRNNLSNQLADAIGPLIATGCGGSTSSHWSIRTTSDTQATSRLVQFSVQASG